MKAWEIAVSLLRVTITHMQMLVKRLAIFKLSLIQRTAKAAPTNFS
jgi:hypothetical protein